jgi:23S rRNA (guanosine2251-2'-O)-methyltransferase
VVPQRRHALEKLVLHATSLRLPIIELEGGSLTALAGFDGHQGVALVVEPRRYATLDEILARAAERDEAPFVLALDSLEDPQNVGTLLRSAEAAGVHGVLFPTHRQAPLTPSAVKASAGAVEHLLLAPVDDLAQALTDLRSHGLRVAGAEADAPLTARQSDLRGPLVIVVGSEGQGLGPAVRRRADLFMRIPMRGAVGSLNAAVAGSILLFEAVAQRDPDGRGAPPQAVPSSEPEAVDALASVGAATTPAEPAPTSRSKPARRRPTDASGDADVADLPSARAAGDDELLPSDGARAESAKAVRKPTAKTKPKATAGVTAAPKPRAAPKPKAAETAARPRAKPKAAATPKPKATAKPKAKAAEAVPTPKVKPRPTAAAKPTGTPRPRVAAKVKAGPRRPHA